MHPSLLAVAALAFLTLACKDSPPATQQAPAQQTSTATRQTGAIPTEPAPAKKRIPFEQRTPVVGDMAPDFELPALHGAPVKLSTVRTARPTVLIFGSYT